MKRDNKIKFIGRAHESIEFNAYVLVQGKLIINAPKNIANAIARRSNEINKGFGDPIFKFSRYGVGMAVYGEKIKSNASISDQLKQIAVGPLMDANKIYLPDGKISVAEYNKRRAAILNPKAK